MIKYFIILLISFPLFAQQYTFDTISTYPEFEVNFKLEQTSGDKYFGQLNCQGFFKKIDFYGKSGKLIDENYISLNECEYLYNNITQCFSEKKSKCIDINDIFDQSCSCQ